MYVYLFLGKFPPYTCLLGTVRLIFFGKYFPTVCLFRPVPLWFFWDIFVQKVLGFKYQLQMSLNDLLDIKRPQKAIKRPKKVMKVVKAKSKASASKISKVYTFFILLWSFSVLYSHISVFLSFKDIKAKKAALVTRNAKMN